MKILSLEINNFGPIEEAFINLDDKGLVNIEGDNVDDPSANSNGSGKSTIADALYWSLFGQTAREVSGDEVISNFSGKDCYVATLIQDGEDRYLVERWRKKKGFKGKLSGLALSRVTASEEFIDLTQGTDKLTQEQIVSVLGCSEDVFTKAVYSGQEALPDLPKMTDKQIKELVEEAGGIEILARAYVLAREHKRAVSEVHAECNRRLMDSEYRLSVAQSTLREYEGRRDEWGDEKASKIARLKNEIVEVLGSAKREDALRSVLDVEALKASVAALNASIAAADGERGEERRLQEISSSAARSAATARANFDAQMARVRIDKRAFDEVESKVGKPCGECGKPHTAEDVSEVRRLAADRLKKSTELANELKAKAAEADAEAAEKLADVEVYRDTMTDVSATMVQIRNSERLIDSHATHTRNIEKFKEQARRIKSQIDELVAETNPFVDMVATQETKVSEVTKEMRVLAAETDEAADEVIVADDVVKTFGPSGVRAYILDTVTPFLNERTAHYLGTLSDGRIEAVWTTLAKNAKGELVERFAIEVEKSGTGGKTFRALSGGEKRKVRLACAFALQDLVASRATKPINLWIGDEIDDALDEAGLERLMVILEEKGREKGTVLVISHNSLRDWIRETATVTMEDGRSRVSGALS